MNPQNEPVSAEISRIHAELARRDLITFCEVISDGRWKRARHLELLCEKMMAAEAHVVAQPDHPFLLMVSMPPRHGKSEVISRLFPAWFLGRNPEMEVIIASYGGDLALDMSRDAQNNYRAAAEMYSWPAVARESSAVSRWAIKGHRGKLQAAGVGGPITGRGGHVIVIDDPVKNIDDGESLIVQRRIFDWYRSTVRTRLAPGGAIVLVMTRWHDGDLAGRLIREMEKGGEQWEVIVLPAYADSGDPLGRAPGEALWPWRYNEDALEHFKKGLGARLFSALYQQDPTADVEGALWVRETHIDPFRVPTVDIESLEEIVIAVDPSGSGDITADEVGIIVCGRDADGHGYVLRDASGRLDPDEWGAHVLELCIEFQTDAVVAEKNYGYKLVKRNVTASVGEWGGTRLSGRNVEVELVDASRGKFQRAEPVANLYAQGLIHHCADADLDDLEDELVTWVGRGPRRSRWSPGRLDADVWGFTRLLIDGDTGDIVTVEWGD